MGLFLAAVGIFGIVSYTASLRQREFSIRMALGASPGTVAIRVVRSGLIAAATGISLGMGASALLSEALGALLGRPSVADPWVLMRSMLILGAVLAAAVYLPAWRAARTDPALALRD